MVEGVYRVNKMHHNNDDPRLEEMLEVIFKFAAGDLTARGTLADDDSALDGVMAGINILGEELQANVAENKQAHQALSKSEALLRTIFDSVQDGIIVADAQTRRYLMANVSMCRMVGYSLDELLKLSVNDLHPAEDLPHVVNEFERIAMLATGIVRGVQVKRKDGTVFYADINASTMILGGVPCLVGVFRDITERKRAEDQQRQASMYARSLIEAGMDPLVTISVAGKIMDVNEAAVQMTGVPRELLTGSDFSMYFTDPDRAHAGYQEAFAKGFIRDYSLTMMHMSGKLTEVLYNASVYRNKKGAVAGVLAVARDITERKRAELAEELAEELASRDGLTGLYNHRTFYSLLRDEIVRTQRSNRPLSLLLLDIDYFKRVNDTHGHQAGDAILRGISDLLVKQARTVDRVCRYGGEEITVILPETDEIGAMKAAERLRAAVERQPFDIGGGKTINISVSIGVATYPQQADSLDALVKAADVALYAAKQGGRNLACRYETEMAVTGAGQ
jgi:diguanylate cyclase (GGDEF)-like protein/PAS domain S-box-containing protein